MTLKNTLLELVQNYSETDILDKIEKYLSKPVGFFHITSLNPEIISYAIYDQQYNQIVKSSHIRINDGVGLVVAGQILGIQVQPRITGVDLMVSLLNYANKNSLSVMLIGGGEKVAERVVECQRKQFAKVKFISLQGIVNIKMPTSDEEQKIFSIVAAAKPQFLFVAFGSPYQEQWIYNHQEQLKGIVCMGVGGAFDLLSGNLPRPPRIIRNLGLEWLFRLITSPKRLHKQSYWIKLIGLAVKERVIEISRIRSR